MRFAVLFAAWAFLGLTAPAMAAGKAPPPPPPPPDLGRAIAFPGGVMVSPDLVYGQIDGFRPLTLDVYQIPARPKETARPTILFVHGGLWIKSDARHAPGFDDFPGLLASLAAKDYVVASVNYRLAGEAHFPAAVQDVKSALRWLRTHASEYDIDTTRVMVWGAEAGGQIASLVGTSCGVNVLEPAADAKSKAPMASDCVQGVVDWGGPVDLTSWDSTAGHELPPNTSTPLGSYMGCEPADCAPGVVKAASPLSYLNNMTPAFLIQQGAMDTLIPVAQSRALYDALQTLHVPSTLVVYPEVGKDFARNGAADPATQAKVIADMEDFIAKTFPPMPAAEEEKAPAPKARKKRK
jgi:acetyl esterase/lipase